MTGAATVPPQPRKSRAGLVLVLVLLTLLVAGAVAVDVLLPAVHAAAPQPVAQPPADAGTWYCPATAGAEESATVSIAAVGDEPAVVTVVRYAGSGPIPDDPATIAPGDQLDVALAAGEASRPVAVRWRGGPAVTTWRGEGADPAAGPCETAPSPTWHITGYETDDGSASRLHLFNPFTEAAVASLAFGTPAGRETLVLAESIVVPPETARVLDLGAEFQPELTDLAVTVTVRSGRLVAQGELVLDPPGEQPAPVGRGLLPGVPAPRSDWGFAFARTDETSQTWLSIYNPADREAAVELRVSDPLPDGQTLLGEQSIPAGGVARIDLAETSASQEFGVNVVVVNDTPVVVARVSALRNDQGAGVATARGGLPGTDWAAVGGGTDGRSSRLALYNPSPEAVRVDVDATGGPPEYAGIEIPPNGRAVVELSAVGSDLAGVPVRIRASGPIVVELRVLSGGEGLGLWTAVAVPATAWTGPDERPPTRHDPNLSSQPLPLPSDPPP